MCPWCGAVRLGWMGDTHWSCPTERFLAYHVDWSQCRMAWSFLEAYAEAK